MGWARPRGLLPSRADLAAMRRQSRTDVVAGLTVAVVALPLALGFGVSAGLGAAAGLATAIVAGILAAVFGGSNLQVSGPTAAMTVVLVPIVAQFGPLVAHIPLAALAGVLLATATRMVEVSSLAALALHHTGVLLPAPGRELANAARTTR